MPQRFDCCLQNYSKKRFDNQMFINIGHAENSSVPDDWLLKSTDPGKVFQLISAHCEKKGGAFK